jgi:hypothetical protein
MCAGPVGNLIDDISGKTAAEKAAKGQGGQFVEVKLNDLKIEFNKVRREDDESHTEDPKAGGSSEEKI